jgi:hypothetical protein
MQKSDQFVIRTFFGVSFKTTNPSFCKRAISDIFHGKGDMMNLSFFVYKLGYRTLRACSCQSSILFGPLLKNEVETPSLSTFTFVGRRTKQFFEN